MWGRLTSSTVAPAASSAATASRIRASTPGSMPLTKYSRGRPRRRPRSVDAASSSLAGSRSSSSGTGSGDEVESRSSRPATACNRTAASRASRANGPIWSSELANATMPYRLTRPYVGLMPTIPVRAAGWRIEPPVSVPMLNGTWNAATAAAEPPLLPPGTRSRVPWVGGRTVGRVLGRGAHRELVHVRLAEDDRARLAQPLGDVGVVRGPVALEDARPRGALPTLDRYEVLERDGHAEQRMGRVERGPAGGPRRRQPRIGRVGGSQRAGSVEREPGVQAVVLALGPHRGGRSPARAMTPRPRAAGRPSRARAAS